MSDLHILLTNDDGIDAPGLGVVHDRLSQDWDVTVVAPAEDRSGTGLTMNTNIRVERHERGYALHGTPADCVEVAIGGLEVDPDLVVSGCNPGPNIGAHTLGRSGTVGAAIEAGLVGTPAIAVSLYDPARRHLFPRDDLGPEAFTEAARITGFLVERAFATDAFEDADYLNVTVPIMEEGHARLRVTRPSDSFEIYTPVTLDEALADHGGELTFRDVFWEELVQGEVDDPVGTDRRAVADGEASISPLRLVHQAESTAAFEAIAAEYSDY